MSGRTLQEEFMISCIVKLHGREEVTGRPNRALLHFQVMSPRRAACQQDTEGEQTRRRSTWLAASLLHPYLCFFLSSIVIEVLLHAVGANVETEFVTSWTEIVSV